MATHSPKGEPLSGHTNAVQSVAFSPDGKLLASSGADNSIILWDVATRQPIGQSLSDQRNSVWSIAFSPNGKLLASGSAGGSASNNTVLILWDVSLESWQARACRIANRNLTLNEWKQYLGDGPYHNTCPSLP